MIFGHLSYNVIMIMTVLSVNSLVPKTNCSLQYDQRLRLAKVINPTYRLHIGALLSAALLTYLLTIYNL